MEEIKGTRQDLIDEVSLLRQRISELEQRESERSRAEEALRDSESLYRKAFENHTAVKLLMDPDSGLILDANKAAVEYYGWPKEKLRSMGIQDINVLPREEVLEALADVKTHRRTYFEFRHKRADGSIRDVAVFTNNISGNGRAILHSVIHDITEHKKTEMMHQNDRKFLRQIIDTLPVFVCVKTEDGRFALANKCLADAYGSTVSGVEGKRDSDFSPTPDEVEHFLADDLDVIRNQKTKRIPEEEITFADGTVHCLSTIKVPLVQSDGTCGQLLCICVDMTEQKRMEQEREHALALLNASIAQSSSGILIADAPDVTIRWANSAALKIRGQTDLTLSGIEVDRHAFNWQTFYPDGRPIPSEELPLSRAVLKGEASENVDLIIRNEKGEDRWVTASASPVRDQKENIVAGIVVFQDITERKHVEELIRLSEERFSKAFFSNPAPLVISEIETGKFIDVNDAWIRMIESTREELIGRTSKDIGIFLDPADRDRLLRKLKTRGCFREELLNFKTATGKHGKGFWSADTITLGNEKVMLSWVHDETERIRAEEELRRLSFAIEQSAEEVIITDPEGVIQYVNAAFEQITGYSRHEAIGQTPRIVKSGRHDDAFYENLWLTVKGGRIWTGHFMNRRKDGTLIQEDATISPLIDSSGQITGFVSLKRDVTEQLKLQAQLRQAQKMEAVGTLAGGIAHDFNNILTIIMGFGTMLQMAIKEFDPARRYVDQILATSQKAANLTKSLLAFSRKQPISLVPISMNTAIQGTEKLLKRLLTEDVELVVSLSPDNDAIILADSTQIDQILFNLATNARDAMKTGGTLKISTSSYDMDDSFKEIHGFGTPGRYGLLTVSDTGCGMDKRTQEKIYDPFFTTKELGKGTGLGLSTVYGIVKQHNGYIDVSSERGEGTVFSIYLPMVETVAEKEKELAADIQGGAETILVAEDDDIVRLLIKDVLTMQGYSVIEAEDGQDAVDKFKEHNAIDLIILDSVMPRKNGRETDDEVRRIDPHIKTLFMSGYTRDIVLDKGIEDGKVDFIMKPILPDTLLTAVRQILDRQ